MKVVNEVASERGASVIAAYLKVLGDDSLVAGDEETILCDLLADLRHWARVEKVDYDAANARGQMHFEAEATGNPDWPSFDTVEVFPRGPGGAEIPGQGGY